MYFIWQLQISQILSVPRYLRKKIEETSKNFRDMVTILRVLQWSVFHNRARLKWIILFMVQMGLILHVIDNDMSTTKKTTFQPLLLCEGLGETTLECFLSFQIKKKTNGCYCPKMEIILELFQFFSQGAEVYSHCVTSL